ncbi:MAG: hypothetical protein ACTSYD_02485 [Candidatus Heimdallarchaeaceae archaeon]
MRTIQEIINEAVKEVPDTEKWKFHIVALPSFSGKPDFAICIYDNGEFIGNLRINTHEYTKNQIPKVVEQLKKLKEKGCD